MVKKMGYIKIMLIFAIYKGVKSTLLNSIH